jgi:hypothetical protein
LSKISTPIERFGDSHQPVRNRLKKDLSLRAALGNIAYYTGKALDRSYLIAKYYRAMLPERLAAVKALSKTRSVDRYAQHERDMKLNLAYNLAQTGKSDEVAKWVSSEVWRADPSAPEAMDTYVYVRMVFAARAKPPRFDEICEARDMFEGALQSTAYDHPTSETATSTSWSRTISGRPTRCWRKLSRFDGDGGFGRRLARTPRSAPRGARCFAVPVW